MNYKFECLEGCGLCCSYRVSVTRDDFEKIKKLGKDEDEFLRKEGEVLRENFAGILMKYDGKCSFFDRSTKRCSIYSSRPQYCRNYPFYFEDTGQIDIDLSCPGVWNNSEIWPENILNYRENDSKKIRDYRELGFLENVFKRKDCYESKEKLREITSNCLETREYPQELIWDDGFFEILNGENIHIDSNGQLINYKFEIKEKNFFIDNDVYYIDEISLLSMSDEELDVLNSYIEIWLNRDIFYNFCLITSFISLPPKSMKNVAIDFLVSLTRQIMGAKKVLLKHWSVYDDIDQLKESIRLFDGRMRAKCKEVNIYNPVEGGNSCLKKELL